MPPAGSFGFLLICKVSWLIRDSRDVLSFVQELGTLQISPAMAEVRCCLTTNESSGIESQQVLFPS